MKPTGTPAQQRLVFVTGGTGYVGSRVIPELLGRGHDVRALVREGSEARAPARCTVVRGDALDGSTYKSRVAPCDTFLHLVGVAHPGPGKARQFREVDLVGVREAIGAARDADVGHFIYVSVAHPAPVMEEFIRVRTECEETLVSSGLHATIVRPWYVLGPEHRWAYVLAPVYWIAERIPATRTSALRLGLVTIRQMVRALVWSVEHPAEGVKYLGVPEIRDAGIPEQGSS